MIEPTNLELLIKYKTWADEVFYQAISSLPDEELRLDRPMLFGNILSLLNHVYAMDLVWKSHLTGYEHNLQTRNPKCTSSFSALRREQSSVNSWYQSYIKSISHDSYGQQIAFTFIGGGEGSMSIVEIIQHVVNHASYHRGHIEGVLYQMSIEPPTTDLPVFLKTIRH